MNDQTPITDDQRKAFANLIKEAQQRYERELDGRFKSLKDSYIPRFEAGSKAKQVIEQIRSLREKLGEASDQLRRLGFRVVDDGFVSGPMFSRLRTGILPDRGAVAGCKSCWMGLLPLKEVASLCASSPDAGFAPSARCRKPARSTGARTSLQSAFPSCRRSCRLYGNSGCPRTTGCRFSMPLASHLPAYWPSLLRHVRRRRSGQSRNPKRRGRPDCRAIRRRLDPRGFEG